MSEALLEAARKGEVATVAQGVNNLSESDRRRIAPQVLKLLRAVKEAYVGRVQEKPWPYAGDVESVLKATETLVLGVSTAPELRKAGHWGIPPNAIALEILKHRPTVVVELVDAIADMTPTRWNSQFALMRALIREGIVERPGNPGYILAMINGLAGPKSSILEAFRGDPGLLQDEVWRLFEVEGAGETSLAAHDKYTPEANSWSRALATLSGEGQLSRDRLLDASLAALGRDFAAFRAGWFSQFHELLAPTRDERGEREADYVVLLSSPVAATVSFAIRALVEAGQVSEANLDRLAPALTSKAASTVKATIKLLPKSERAAVIAATALPQATRDGQVALLAFIEATRSEGPRVAALVSAAESALAPSLRRGSEIHLADGGYVLPHAASNSVEVSILSEPVQSVGDLTELLATLLEHIEDAHDVERALDGVSRLCDRDDLTIKRLEVVARRAEKLLTASHARPFAGHAPRADIAGLVIAWVTGNAPPMPPFREDRFRLIRTKTGPRRSVLGFLSYRALEVAARAAHGNKAPILSLPTTRGGAIDRETLESRRQELARLKITPGDADALQAALRTGEVKEAGKVGFDFGSTKSSHSDQGKTYKHTYFELTVDPPLKAVPPLADVPGLFVAAISAFGASAEADYCGNDGGTGLAEAVRWVGTVWPAKRELFYAKGAAEMGRNVDWWQAMWHVRCFLEPLLLPTEPIQQMGTLLLSLGLAAKEPGERALATDVFIGAVQTQRIDLRALGETLGKLYDNGVVKGSRIASALSDAGRVSDGHTEAIAITIEHLLAATHGPPPPDLHAVLETLSDALASLPRTMQNPDARAYLARVKGTGKAALAAKQLLATARP
jgi:hypothetical protein